MGSRIGVGNTSLTQEDQGIVTEVIGSTLEVTATAVVTHHAPCVPECPVCYPAPPLTQEDPS